jgi:hypothetical protein
MNQVSRTPAADTPATQLRDAVESAGFTIAGLTDDLTPDQVLSIAESLQAQLRSAIDRATPATDADRQAVAMAAGVIELEIDVDSLTTQADVNAACVRIGSAAVTR